MTDTIVTTGALVAATKMSEVVMNAVAPASPFLGMMWLDMSKAGTPIWRIYDNAGVWQRVCSPELIYIDGKLKNTGDDEAWSSSFDYNLPADAGLLVRGISKKAGSSLYVRFGVNAAVPLVPTDTESFYLQVYGTTFPGVAGGFEYYITPTLGGANTRMMQTSLVIGGASDLLGATAFKLGVTGSVNIPDVIHSISLANAGAAWSPGVNYFSYAMIAVYVVAGLTP